MTKELPQKWWNEWIEADTLGKYELIKNLPALKGVYKLANEKNIDEVTFNNIFTTTMNGLFEDLWETVELNKELKK